MNLRNVSTMWHSLEGSVQEGPLSLAGEFWREASDLPDIHPVANSVTDPPPAAAFYGNLTSVSLVPQVLLLGTRNICWCLETSFQFSRSCPWFMKLSLPWVLQHRLCSVHPSSLPGVAFYYTKRETCHSAQISLPSKTLFPISPFLCSSCTLQTTFCSYKAESLLHNS